MTIHLLDWESLRTYLQPRAAMSHKGDYGHSLLIGGNYHYAGAIYLASEACARVGSGLTSVATQAEHAQLLPLRCPEIMAHAVEGNRTLIPLINKASVIAIGPGLGQDPWAHELFAVTITSKKNLIIDADALNLLAQSPQQSEEWILTPHPGEAARLLNTDVISIQSDRLAASQTLQKKYGGVIVLKGHHTLIANDSTVIQCNAGNPGMASGGMGDLLTGIITGLVAQRLPLFIAAQIGVYIHSTAADLAASNRERGLLASDLLAYLPTLVNPDV